MGKLSTAIVKGIELEFLSIDEYGLIAKKILHKSHPTLYKDIVGDTEKFGDVINALMTADWRFNGTGNIHGFRKQYVSWTIRKLYGANNKIKTINEKLEDGSSLLDLIVDSSSNTLEETDVLDDFKKLYVKIESSSILSKKEREYLQRYFINKEDLADIARSYGLYKKSIIAVMRKGLLKLGMHNEYFKRFCNRDRRRATSSSGVAEVGV